ncbi:MAG: LCP family protein [Acidobacteriota bacterium]|nr:LCP family protein [Acidobacteriota bacterium]
MYLWLHQSLAAMEAHTPAMRRAEAQLKTTPPGHAAIALVLGDNQRAGIEASAGGRSDTILLIRADPRTHTISMLSLPRDLRVPVWCPHRAQSLGVTRIDYAFAYCGPAGSLETVEKLTGLRISYLVTVDYHGFKEIVNDIGGIWLDIDRSYYNRNVGTASTDYSNIDLQPGYQLLSGGSALEFVRFRHTDSDFYRQARDQEFLRALKQQLARKFNPLELPKIVSTITHNVEIGGCSSCLGESTVLGYALFALTLPRAHLMQNYIQGATDVYVGGADELTAPPQSIAGSVYDFIHPAVPQAPSPARRHGPSPQPARTTVTVLNGNGVPGAAALAGSLLPRRRYAVQPPPLGAIANAPTMDYGASVVFYDPAKTASRTAAVALAQLVGGATVARLPRDPRLRAVDPGSALVLVVGRSFQGRLGASATRVPAANDSTIGPALASVRRDTTTGASLLGPLARRVPFALETPTVLEADSVPDTLPGDQPVRLYTIAPGRLAVRLVFRTGGNAYWGIEETDFASAPVLASPSLSRSIGGRRFQLYFSGSHLHMVVLLRGTDTYWVVNTLLDALSNKTMLAIAEGLRPLRGP